MGKNISIAINQPFAWCWRLGVVHSLCSNPRNSFLPLNMHKYDSSNITQLSNLRETFLAGLQP
jgi:hypothetical protein